ncbi:hypothetical protein F8568_040535 [Actinomadura sp. LD22]|uniref:MFS transporter n=1 Tax=Actinomadura physcomitrii TaxID=2650748 RepID=A0A6I4MT62_9ACTN|nr:hypothetical protein [Actinomadura physcomitrii]MWA06531.1 hypothetical protein [Actinomadura physcomitrii]
MPALSSSAVYLGTSLGAGLGGWVIGSSGPGALPIIAAACVLTAAALFGLPGRHTTRMHEPNAENRHVNV